MIRNTVAVILGYLSFAVGLTGLVYFSFVEPVLGPGPLRLILLLAALIALGSVVGLLSVVVSGSPGPGPARVVAVLTTIMTLGNIVLNKAVEPVWFKVCVLAFAIPAIVGIEAWLRSRRHGKH